jgi:nucleotide-binding universal stress UspA family protein
LGLGRLGGASHLFNKIVVAYDESPEAGKALLVGIKLASVLGSQLSAITVIEPYPTYYSFAIAEFALSPNQWSEQNRAKYSALHTIAKQKAKAAGLWLDTELVEGEEVASIVEFARKHQADLLIVGMRKHKLLNGGTAKDIAERSPCALMGIR